MDEGKDATKHRIGAMELLAMGGFTFFFGWMFVSFYWLFTELLPGYSVAERDIIQLFVFAGLAIGYTALHFVGKSDKYDPFKVFVLAAETVLVVLLPVAALLLVAGMAIPAGVLCAVNLFAGFGGAGFTVGWLAVCGRLRIGSYRRFTSLSLLGGGLLFALVAFMPLAMQPVFCIVYAVSSAGLLLFSGFRRGGEESDVDGQRRVPWNFTNEVEPSLVAFGIVFGLTFVYLFNSGPDYVLIGLLSTIPGAAIVAVLSIRGKTIGITVMQRVLLCIVVLSCLSVPFASNAVQLACSCLVLAAWAAFKAVNYALIVKKSYEYSGVDAFRQIPSRLVFSALGFFLGWAVAAGITVVFGPHSEAFTIIRLMMAFVVVVVVMLFFPVSVHHEEAIAETAGAASVLASVPLEAVAFGEGELFERRCTAVAELYQLSPRETDILKFLAKGRNAAYIQNKLCISPHTVKSHIYSIYRKLDIHSQQTLMDFVEAFPLDSSAGSVDSLHR